MPHPQPLSTPLHDLLTESLTTLTTTSHHELTPHTNLPPHLLPRALYHHWLTTTHTWRPYLELDPRQLHPEHAEAHSLLLSHDDRGWLRRALNLARGGWLYLGPGWTGFGRIDSLARQAKSYDVRLLLAGRGKPQELPPEHVQALHALNETFHVATDPALHELRRTLLTHARNGSVLHLRGELGTGRRELVTWAHQHTQTGRALTRITPQAHQEPRYGDWALYEHVGAMAPKQLTGLAARIAPPVRTRRRSPDEELPNIALERPLRRLARSSPSLEALLRQAQQFARFKDIVLTIYGETGAGKERLAEAIHESSQYGKIVTVDLNTILPDRLEAELFGHVKGAYTGADTAREGLIRSAHEGTLFLDEVGRLTLSQQARLLRVIESKRVRPVGGDREVEARVRWIVASHQDLRSLAATGEFLPDLYQRLRGLELHLPPLRERAEDIPKLSRAILGELAKGSEQPTPSLSEEALEALVRWPWPRNVRELKDTLREASVKSGFGVIEPRHLGEVGQVLSDRGPVFLTSTLTPADIDALPCTDAHRLRQLTRLSCEVPALHQRSVDARRHLILARLAGRPILSDALEGLAERPWSGNLPELHDELDALLASSSGPITRHTLARVSPHLLRAASSAPIVVLMHPSVQPNGLVTGLQHTFHAPALVVGRGDLRQLDGPDPLDEPLPARRDALRARVPYGEPAMLNLGAHPELSRQHLLVVLGAEGLEVLRLPKTKLDVGAAPLGEAKLYKVTETQPVPIGRGGQIQVRKDDQVLLQLFVFQGKAAQQALSEKLRDTPLLSAATTLGRPERPRVSWVLSEEEVEVCVELATRALRGGRGASQRIRGALPAVRDGGHERLAHYLDVEAARQQLNRLIQYNSGQPLAKALGARLAADPDGYAIWRGLLKETRAAVAEPPKPAKPAKSGGEA